MRFERRLIFGNEDVVSRGPGVNARTVFLGRPDAPQEQPGSKIGVQNPRRKGPGLRFFTERSAALGLATPGTYARAGIAMNFVALNLQVLPIG